ncbi:MAG: hypothetical protein KC438_09740 [Thermomicrobiales bacterium]|nr:hypothetical protein [Thermomicrobiales bacterium]
MGPSYALTSLGISRWGVLQRGRWLSVARIWRGSAGATRDMVLIISTDWQRLWPAAGSCLSQDDRDGVDGVGFIAGARITPSR